MLWSKPRRTVSWTKTQSEHSLRYKCGHLWRKESLEVSQSSRQTKTSTRPSSSMSQVTDNIDKTTTVVIDTVVKSDDKWLEGWTIVPGTEINSSGHFEGFTNWLRIPHFFLPCLWWFWKREITKPTQVNWWTWRSQHHGSANTIPPESGIVSETGLNRLLCFKSLSTDLPPTHTKTNKVYDKRQRRYTSPRHRERKSDEKKETSFIVTFFLLGSRLSPLLLLWSFITPTLIYNTDS